MVCSLVDSWVLTSSYIKQVDYDLDTKITKHSNYSNEFSHLCNLDISNYLFSVLPNLHFTSLCATSYSYTHFSYHWYDIQIKHPNRKIKRSNEKKEKEKLGKVSEQRKINLL